MQNANIYAKNNFTIKGVAARLYAKSRHHLEENMAIGVALTMVVILAHFCVLVAGGLLSILLSTMMLDISLTESLSLTDIMGSAMTLALSMLIIFPLRLSIKGWYQRLNGGFVPAALAFVILTSPKRYWRAFSFGAVGFFVKLFSFTLCMLPCFVVSGLLRYSLSLTLQNGIGIDGALIVLGLADFLLLALGVTLGVLASIRFFYMDYLYLLGQEKNVIKAIFRSNKLYKSNNRELISVIWSIIPHFLSCLLILPIPFAVPKIAAIMAVHAQDVI